MIDIKMHKNLMIHMLRLNRDSCITIIFLSTCLVSTSARDLVSYQPLGKTPNFFRSIISNPATREEDIDFMLDEMERLGSDL